MKTEKKFKEPKLIKEIREQIAEQIANDVVKQIKNNEKQKVAELKKFINFFRKDFNFTSVEGKLTAREKEIMINFENFIITKIDEVFGK